MGTHYLKKTIGQWVCDDFFILWSLLPEEEKEHTWIDHYLALYPEEKDNLEKARQLVRSLKLNRKVLSAEDKEALRKRIVSGTRKRRLPHRLHAAWRYAAACFLIFGCAAAAYYLADTTSTPSAPAPLLLAQEHLPKLPAEVELRLAEKKIQIADKAVIQMTGQGEVHITASEMQQERRSVSSGDAASCEWNRLSVPEGRRSSIILPDGTKIWVNSGSVLHFPPAFKEDKRMIYVEGEVFLEVTKDAHRPFYVKTDRMEVKVLGTSFGVKAYKDEVRQSVVLKEGRVAVEGYEAGRHTIRPNDLLVLEKNRMSIYQVDTYEYISWIDGILQFREKNLEEVLRSLSRYYRVEFAYPPEAAYLKCSGKLVLFENIDQVLQTLQQTLALSFQRKDNRIEVTSTINPHTKK